MPEAAIHAVETGKGFPTDLRQWVCECSVIKLALEAAHKVTESRSAPLAPASANFNPQMMLTLLTYCYAAGIHGSADIEWAIEHDPAVRYICARSTPDSYAIRRFRRANRQPIEHCLAFVFAEARRQKLAELNPLQASHPTLGVETYSGILEAVRRKLQLAVLMDAATAD